MLSVEILVGLPGSGKSTYAKDVVTAATNSIKRVNKDDLRAMLDGGKWSKDNEKYVLELRDNIILTALERGKHVIVDDTNLNPVHIQHIKELVTSFIARTKREVKVTTRFFDTPLDECIKRDQYRTNPVGEKVIKDMHARWLSHMDKQQLRPFAEQNWELPKAIICDLDGTLAWINDRSPYDAKACINDDVNWSVNNVLQIYWKHGYAKILFVSGRSSEGRQETVKWLQEKAGWLEGDYELHMRAEGDSRKDAVVKKEMYDNFIKDKYYVSFVLDDRNAVVDFWRKTLGLTCFQVNYGDF